MALCYSRQAKKSGNCPKNAVLSMYVHVCTDYILPSNIPKYDQPISLATQEQEYNPYLLGHSVILVGLITYIAVPRPRAGENKSIIILKLIHLVVDAHFFPVTLTQICRI